MRRVFDSSRRLLVDPPSSRGGYKIVNLLRVNLTSETLSEPITTHITTNETQARTKLLEHQYRKTKTDQFIISNEHLLEAKENETQLEDLPDGNRSHEKLKRSSLVLAMSPAVIENHRDYRGREL